jgi:predicted metalloprotease with PDZ domain
MIHLALPDTGQEHAWLSEGLATYVEGIARAQSGNRTQEDVWAEQMRSMPKGLPQPDDRGLDRTHTWGRTYWGGALFCLVADVKIHQQTKGRFGLQEALRAIARKSGGLSTDWPIERVFTTGDEATGSRTLQELYAEWKEDPITPDLIALWRDLGIERDGDSIRLRDDALLASIRRDIMRPRVSQP